MFKTTIPLVLASNSPRRQHFLKDLGLPFSVLLPSSFVEEIDCNLLPFENAMTIAKGKALAVQQEHNIHDSLIIASDTIVVLNNESAHSRILGKPKNVEEAYSMIKLLNGNKHTVITAVCFISPNNEIELFYDKSDVYFANWEDDILLEYAKSGEGLDKAGAYALQGKGTFLVEKIIGSYSTVIGLPVHLCIEKLKGIGFITV